MSFLCLGSGWRYACVRTTRWACQLSTSLTLKERVAGLPIALCCCNSAAVKHEQLLVLSNPLFATLCGMLVELAKSLCNNRTEVGHTEPVVSHCVVCRRTLPNYSATTAQTWGTRLAAWPHCAMRPDISGNPLPVTLFPAGRSRQSSVQQSHRRGAHAWPGLWRCCCGDAQQPRVGGWC
jgi:hypothetical protein